MAKKAFKDFVIVRNYAKLVDDYTYDKESNTIMTCFPFGDTIAEVIFRFGKDKRTKAAEIKIDEIYEMYGQKFFITVKEFAKAICENYALGITGDDELTFIKSEVKDNSFEHTASNGLSTVEAIFERIKEVLNLKMENPLNEELIRNIHRDYLKKEKWLSLGIGVVSAAVGIIIMIVILANGAGGLLGLLAILIMLAGLGAGIFYLLRFLRFKKNLERSQRGYK